MEIIQSRNIYYLLSAIKFFYWSHVTSFQKLSNERSLKVSIILTLREVISIRTLRMRIISAIVNFYWSHAIDLFNNCPFNVLISFSWILTLTEVISIRNLRFFDRQRKWRLLITPWLNAAEPNWQSKKLFWDDW